jgi:uncharacterized cupin superfamily protein
MSNNQRFVVERAGDGDFGPFMHRGNVNGEIHDLPLTGELDVGVWRSEPATYDHLFEVDEAFVVLEGAVTIELVDTGDKLDLTQGDVGYFRAGQQSVWTVTESFVKFVVVPGAGA